MPGTFPMIFPFSITGFPAQSFSVLYLISLVRNRRYFKRRTHSRKNGLTNFHSPPTE